MPLYEYQCDACGHRFEAIQQAFSSPPPDKCPKCGGLVHKLQSAPAFHLKGSGWYATDYGKKDVGGTDKTDKAATPAKTDASAVASSDAKTTPSTTDSKPATESKSTTPSTTTTK